MGLVERAKKLGNGKIVLNRVGVSTIPSITNNTASTYIDTEGLSLNVENFSTINISYMGGNNWLIQGIKADETVVKLDSGFVTHFPYPKSYDINDYSTLKIISASTDGSARNCSYMTAALN